MRVETHLPSKRELFYWVFVPLIQAQLTEFQVWWNQHHIRSQADKNMPSGHVPTQALRYPEQFAGLNCLIKVPKEAIRELRDTLEADVGPYAQHMSWFSEDFRLHAEAAYATLSSPPISLNNAWSIFRSLSDVLEPMYHQ